MERKDIIKNMKEEFTYDNLDRLTSAKVTNLSTNISFPTINYNYEGSSTVSNGNITSKSDVGQYKYTSIKTNAVTQIHNSNYPNLTYATVAPDNISLFTQQITYTPYLKTESISELNGYVVDFVYNQDFDRVKSTLTLNGMPIESKIYLGDYELRKDLQTGVVQKIHYISGAQGTCLILVGINEDYEPHFIYTDHLGSIVTITNVAGTIEAEQNFDAWGRKRNTNDWTYNNIAVNIGWLYRGYTGHEHLQEFALINMNGRIYDHVLGRILSPDNLITNTYNSQAYNRYTYAFNNPLKFTDPDGNLPILAPMLIGAAIGFITGGIEGKKSGIGFWNGAM